MRILMVTLVVPHPQALSGASLVMDGALGALRDEHALTLLTFAPTAVAERRALKQLRASGLRVFVMGESWPVAILRSKRYMEGLVGRFMGWPALGSPLIEDPRLPRTIDRLIGQQRFDVLQVENIGLANFSYKSPIPCVLVEHEVRPADQVQPSIWRRFDRIQVFTEADADALCKTAPQLGDRVRINPFGVEIAPAAAVRSEEPDTLVFVGGFKHSPNVDAALWLANEIMPGLRGLRPQARLLIVGSDPPKVVRDLTRDGIIVTGRVPSVEEYLDRASVVLAPLRTGGGMRVKVLQAMARRKAIVATPLAVEGLRVDRALSPVVTAADAAGITRAAADLLGCREARRRLARRAQDYVRKHHSWSGYRYRLETIYAELRQSIGKESGPPS